MKTRDITLSIVALGMAACTSTQLLPGRCDSTSDCAPGLTCNLDRTLEGNGRCVAPDDGGSTDGTAGSTGGASPDASPEVGGSSGAGIAGSDGGLADTNEVKPGCASSAECPALSPICGADGVCRACNASGVAQTACATLDSTRPTCSSTGACVECGVSADCKDSTKPICGTDGVCRACNASNVGQTACTMVDPTHPTCAMTGACVVCSTSADCKTDPTKPICDVANQKCVVCTADSQCVTKLGAKPGVCMAHQDGRCATDAETFYVSGGTGCSDTGANAGASSMPFCSLDPVAKGTAGTRALVVVRGAATAATSAFTGTSELSIVGQGAAIVGAAVGPSAVHLGTGAKVYMRDLSVTALAGVGIQTEAASTLRLQNVTVSNSAKGGIQIGGSFDIANSTITGNGPGSDGAFLWGGIDIQFPPVGGPSRLSLVTISNNKSIGVVCSSAITATDTLTTGNAGGDIGPTCGFTSCAAAGAMCGAQP